MKSANELFSHINIAPLEKIAQGKCKQAIKSLMPITVAQYITHIFVKHDTLYIAFSHEGVVFEADYKLKSLKSLILDIVQNFECETLQFKKTRAYFKPEEQKPQIKTTWLEKERSAGAFDNNLKNPKLHDALEEIRSLICKNQ